ncbi:MAG: chromosomal replication initiator protein DnaA [Desulfobacteraceae bacterium]|nr:chromosomal replication initiator protein DnaA [Desulfobacterales bacterium]MBL6966908.1 chromosomal replication initiator protein DnaA [Desulfobacteraceae bacterium]MBL7172467.1 chromosomal replication initiator protein DnaA [Desulfobacteraceae bacterium]MBU0733543.1 chromosomal replication initiator protein DnaA [Pseudomonadota bacterium]
MTRKNNIWSQIRRDFETGIAKSDFKTWLSQASLKEIDSDVAVIEVPNKFVARWLQDHYTEQIQTILGNNFKTPPAIRFTYAEPSSDDVNPKNGVPARSDADIPNGLNSFSTFSGFVTGKSNYLAYSSALNVADSPAQNYNPLYIFSELGLGKTHLLNAIGNLVVENNPSVNIMYLSADRFVSQFLIPSGTQTVDRFWESDGSPDFLLLDDMHLLADNKSYQYEFLSLCSSFLESAKQLVVAATYPPAKIKSLLPELRSRLEWGLIAEIHPPGQRTKMKIIKKNAKQENLDLPDDVVFFLANHTDDIRSLTEYVVSLKSYATSYKRPIDISTVKSVIKKKPHPADYIDLQHIQKLTAEYFNISVSDLLSNKKARTFSYPRQVAIYLTKKLTSLSLKEIGNGFGNKHHSTIIYAENRIEEAKSKNKSVLNDINKVQRLLL